MIDTQTITSLFEAFKGKRILIIGDVMIDSYLWGKVDRISPEAPVPVVALKKRENRLGGAANVALNVQSLGGIPILCSVTGQDDKSQQFKDLLHKQQMTTEGILCSTHRITTVKFRIIGNNVQMLRVDEEDQQSLNSHDSNNLFESIKSIVEHDPVGAIVFEDYDKGVITPELIAKVVELANTHKLPVVVDPKKKNFLHYHGVTLFKPNLKELREGLKLDDDLDLPGKVEHALAQLQNSLDIKIALATLSEKGIIFSQKGNENLPYFTGVIPAHIRNIADVSGAGDTVISVAAMCLASGAGLPLLASLANLAGGLVCEHVGVVPVDKDELYSEAISKLCQ